MSDQKLSAIIFDERGGQQTLPANKSTVMVGRAPHCDIVLNHPSVSAEHVRAWLEGGRIWLQDLGSEGGTFLNGTRLPTLKPMLVRDVDLIKLGTCPATIGFEIPSPREARVRMNPAVDPENTLTEIRPLAPSDGGDLERRRGEIARAGRELAELKLQLQMARLDKNAGEDVRKQLLTVRDEVAAAQEQREQLKRGIQKLRGEREEALRQTRAEVASRLEAAERDIAEMRDRAGRRLGHWKVDVVSQLERGLREMTEAKARAWITRPLSRDMILEWASELDQLIRAVVLEDTGQGHSISVPEDTRTMIIAPKAALPVTPPPAPAPTSVVAKPAQIEPAPVASPAPQPPPPPSEHLGRAAFMRLQLARGLNMSRAHKQLAIGASLAILVGAALTKKLRPSPSHREVASEASSTVMALPKHFHPRQTKDFKPSYVENIMFTEHYDEIENDPRYRAQWIAELSRVASGAWHLNEGVVANLGNKEQTLVANLLRAESEDSPSLAASLTKLKAIEAQFQAEMTTLIGPKIYAQFLALKKANFGRFRARGR